MSHPASRPFMIPGLFRRAARPAWAMVDQAVSSLSSFVVILLLARALTPEAFGTFSLVLATVYVLSGLQTALAGQVHNVLGAVRDQMGYARLSGLLLTVQAAFALVTAGACLVAGLLVRLIAPESAMVTIFMGMALMSLPFLVRDGARRMLYTRRRLGVIIPMGLVSAVAMLVGAIGLHEHWLAPTAWTSILILSAAAGLGSVPGMIGLIRDGLSFHGDTWRTDLRESWKLARYMVGGELVRVVNSSLANWIITLAAGLPALGAYRAAVHFTNALNPIQQAVGSYLPSVAARIWGSETPGRYRSRVGLMGLRLIVSFSALALLLAMAGPRLLDVAYGGRYAGYPMALMLSLTVLARVFDFSRLVAQIGLIAARTSQVVFVTAVTQSALLLTVGQTLIFRLHILGAAIWEPVIRLVQAAISVSMFMRIGSRPQPLQEPFQAEPAGTLLAAGAEADVLLADHPGRVVKKYRVNGRSPGRATVEARVLERLHEDRDAIPPGIRYPRVVAHCHQKQEIEMERVPGVTLRDAVRQGAIEPGTGTRIAEGLMHYTETVGHAFHDFSPANIMWDQRARQAWLIDVGAQPLLGEPEAASDRCAHSLGYYLGIVAYEWARPQLRGRAGGMDHLRLFHEMSSAVEKAGYPVSQRRLLRTGWQQFRLSAFQGPPARQAWYRSVGVAVAAASMLLIVSARAFSE